MNYINGSYQNNSKQNYTTYTVGPTLEWKFTVRTQLAATLGYTARNNSSPSRPDYSAPTGRATLTIADAGRGSLTACGLARTEQLR